MACNHDCERPYSTCVQENECYGKDGSWVDDYSPHCLDECYYEVEPERTECYQNCTRKFQGCKIDCYEAGYYYEYDCYPAGRPFRETPESSVIVASIDSSCGSNCPWSETNVAPSTSISTNAKLSEKFIQQALGEHASIASFASFTIALMTHNAPPLLIEQALLAAQDELRHARLVFALAAKYRQEGGDHSVGLGPSNLPESHLYFEHNFASLGVSVAKEGCIEETLSAIMLAIEADETDIDEDDRQVIQSIALDESRHSSLAWRTVRWICEQKSVSCQLIMKTVLHRDFIGQEVSKRFSGAETSTRGMIQDLFDFLLVWLENGTAKHCEDSQDLSSDTSVDAVVRAITVDVCSSRSNLDGKISQDISTV